MATSVHQRGLLKNKMHRNDKTKKGDLFVLLLMTIFQETMYPSFK